MPLKDDILQAQDLPREPVAIDLWKGSDTKPIKIFVRCMSGVERDEFEQWVTAIPDAGKRTLDIEIRLCVMTMTDAVGVNIFTVEDAPALARKNRDAITKVFLAACKINGIGLKMTEEAAGKSDPAPGDSSPSGSPSTSG